MRAWNQRMNPGQNRAGNRRGALVVDDKWYK